MSWRIDRDYLADGNWPSNVGRGQYADGDLMPFRFRILDDDGEVYYGGTYDATALADAEGAHGNLYEALRWAEADAGASDLQVKATDYRATLPAHIRQYVTVHDAGGDWHSIYG